MENPAFAVLVATIFTALVHSSAATTSIVIVLASQGLITLEAGIALALGANIGTCATALLAAIGKPREKVQCASHGHHPIQMPRRVLVVLPFLDPFTQVVSMISPAAAAGVPDLAAQAAVVPRQIANAHTVFNVGIALLFLPFAPLLVRVVGWLVPDRKEMEDAQAVFVRYLDESMVDTPSLALGLVRREVSRMGDVLEVMLAGIPAGGVPG